ncbi:hypothetical protein ABW20_dc0102854 [Dactylellina cionopaga]|nr:hypothetical protein ABW20_dc0102854 [Dactylellina cionopaga]
MGEKVHRGIIPSILQVFSNTVNVNSSHTIGQAVISICNFNIIRSRREQQAQNRTQWNNARAVIRVSIAQYNAATTAEERKSDQSAFRSRKGGNEMAFYRNLITIVRYWLNYCPGGHIFLANELGNLRRDNGIQEISTDPIACLNWKYWVQLNSKSLSRSLFGDNQDAVVPAFWLDPIGEPFRQSIALLLIDLGSRVVAYANTPGNIDDIVGTMVRDAPLKVTVNSLDHYTLPIPYTFVSDIFPYTITGARRPKEYLYKFERCAIQSIPQIPDPANPGQNIDRIPATCVWP